MSESHTTPAWVHLAAAAALLILLLLSLFVWALDLGMVGFAIGMGIAATKAAIVAIIYMHLSHASSLIRLASGAALLWMALLIGLTLADFLTRRPPPPSP